jgi:ATP-dependent DNA helicase RecG
VKVSERLTPPEFSTDGMFTVTLRRPFDFEKWVNKWVNKLSEKQLQMNGISFTPYKIKMRFLRKIIGFLKK